MHTTKNSTWRWKWPSAGPNPVHQGLDLEVFDRPDYPYSETFVREAVQNSLDARLDPSKPVCMRFTFHEGPKKQSEAFLADVIQFRKQADLDIPEEWNDNHVKWLVVEDFNTEGLSGSLNDRSSDFWNYWLNFGISNKDGRGRGGRGIGRVTFLIASRLKTVIGYTRRYEDSRSAVCGMAVLKAHQDGNNFLSTHAYLAQAEQGSIYSLYDSKEFLGQVQTTFRFSGYDGEFTSGLGLAILYPHKKLERDGILAAAIANFSPAIMDGTLVLDVDGIVLNKSSMAKVAEEVSENFNDVAIKEGVSRYLDLIKHTKNPPEHEIMWPTRSKDWHDLKESDMVKSILDKLENQCHVVCSIQMYLEQHGKENLVELKAVVAATPPEKRSINQLFRGGMSLPDVWSKSDQEQFDLVVSVEDSLLVTYLNLCEGKAHLELLENEEVLQKLEQRGFTNRRKIKRAVKSFLKDMCWLLTPDILEPSADVFKKFFSIPKPTKRPSPQRQGLDDSPDDMIPLPLNLAPFLVEHLTEGCRVRANPEYDESAWPINLTVTFAYANGARRPPWDEHDFLLENLSLHYEDCQITTRKGNRVRASDCGSNCSIRVTGFDTNRELDATIGWDRNAPED